MHGMVFGELKKFVDKNMGGDSWQSLLKQLNLRKVYIPIQEYPDEEILSLVGAASQATGISVHDLLIVFGKFIAPTLLHSYHRQITASWTLMDLLENTESTIHKVVRLRNPNASPPQLQIERINVDKIVITYTSPRRICGLALGIAQGLADQFGEQVEITQNHCMLSGDAACIIEIQRISQDKAPVTFANLKFSKHASEAVVPPPLYSKKAIVNSADAPIIIAGTGPVGIQAAREILKLAPHYPLVVYGAEPWEAYNRVHLSELLAGEIGWEEIVHALNISADNLIAMHINAAITKIDRKNKTITDANGQQQAYSYLILAVGSHARRVDLGNRNLLGIHTYRDIDDVQRLMMHVIQSERTVILGGGILGMEVAFALKAQNTQAEVIILHRHECLMNNELDTQASGFLLQQVEVAGIRVIFNTSISTYLGEHELTGIQLKDGHIIPCDTLVVCTGIIPNTKLATESGLTVNKGIAVNDFLQTSDPNIYAVGECLEHDGKTYGLLGPGLEQASIAVENIISGNIREYHGTPRSVRAKIKHLPICTVEKTLEIKDKKGLQSWVFIDQKSCQFKKLYFHKGYLVKATGIGEWSEFNPVQQAIEEGFKPKWWHHYRFLKTGSLWSKSKQNPMDWPPQSLVCTCCAVTRGEIGSVVNAGYLTLESISEHTGAMQGCGSCKPVIAQLAGITDNQEIFSPNHTTLLVTSFVALCLMMGMFLPSFSIPTSVQEQGFFAQLLFDNFWQQVSGYSALSLIIISLPLLLNKHLKLLTFSSYDTWRLIHVIVIALAALILLIHTNMSMGHNFNFQVMTMFLITMISGTIISLLIYFEHSFFDFIVARLRVFWVRLHILLVSLFCVFIALHITSVYYF